MHGGGGGGGGGTQAEATKTTASAAATIQGERTRRNQADIRSPFVRNLVAAGCTARAAGFRRARRRLSTSWARPYDGDAPKGEYRRRGLDAETMIDTTATNSRRHKSKNASNPSTGARQAIRQRWLRLLIGTVGEMLVHVRREGGRMRKVVPGADGSVAAAVF